MQVGASEVAEQLRTFVLEENPDSVHSNYMAAVEDYSSRASEALPLLIAKYTRHACGTHINAGKTCTQNKYLKKNVEVPARYQEKYPVGRPL